MSSSDSDEDCYGNVAKTLQNLKSKYQDDKFCSANLLKEDSVYTISTTESKPEKLENAEPINIESIPIDTTIISDDEELDRIIASNKRVTRSLSRSMNLSLKESPKPKGRPSRKKKPNSNDTETSLDEVAPSKRGKTRTRARGRASRGRRGRSSGIHPNARSNYANDLIPTYSIGNTDEYPDQSDNVLLFSLKPNEIVNLEDSDVLDENEELSVKIHWQSAKIVKFTIRKYQKLLQVFDYFAAKSNVSKDKLLFIYDDKILKADDTPDSINYSIAKFIEGGIVQQDVSKLVTSNEKMEIGLTLKFQYPNAKRPFEVTVQNDELLSLAMIKCAELMEIPLNKLRFEFDGDILSGKSTPKDLEMDGGECIDVKILR